MQTTYPLTRDLVLIGGGHTHALVLRRWGMRPLPGARLTVINPAPTAPYTGMLPGFVAGHYARDALEIDLVRLARFAGARLVLGAAEGIDREAKRIHIAGRAPVSYDVASINLGITSELPALPGFANHGQAAKPLGPFAARWSRFRAEVAAGARPPDIVVIGGGVGGVELALAMAHALRTQRPRITILERNTLLPGLATSAVAALQHALQAFDITVLEGATPAKVTTSEVYLSDGRAIPAQLTVGAAGATPHRWLSKLGLDTQDGFLCVSETLRTSDPDIFAAGDCAHLTHAPRPKAGVFAVRQAPVLLHNLRATITGRGHAMRPYRPQKAYLKLISLGAQSAVADKWGGRLSGPWVWRWKDRIDQRFMQQFRDLPAMAQPAVPKEAAAGLSAKLEDAPLCGGCGAKVGPEALSRALAAPGALRRPDVTRLPGDDAALLSLGGASQVISTDHLRAVTDDLHLMARLAATHALGDVYAMAAAPQAALATVILPQMSAPLQARSLDEILHGARLVLDAAGAELVGGHTTLGQELTIGFTVTGLPPEAPVTLAGARPGDRLLLTKPIGSGTILAAEMQGRAEGPVVAQAYETMLQPQGRAAALLTQAHAMTDVTGFGLAGHLMNICRASGVGAQLTLAHVPLMEGAEALAGSGIRSTIWEQNRAAVPISDLPQTARAALLFDPQTCGGLLAAVSQDRAAPVLEALRAEGYPAEDIGEVTKGPPHLTLL